MKNYITASLFALSIFAVIFFIPTTFGKVSEARASTKKESQIINDKNIVAIVNDQKITKNELYNLLVDTYGDEALDVLIRRTLIYQTAKKEGVHVTDSEIEQKLKTLVAIEIDGLIRAYRIKDKEELEKELARIGGNLAQLEEKLSRKMRKQAEVELLAEKAVEKTITITDEELQKAYEQEYGEKIEASQIVFKTRREAEEALKKLRSGADFATLAKNESIDRASASRGGKMQPFSPKYGIGKEVANLKIGEMSGIIKTDHGHHVVKIIDRKPASKKGFKAVRSELEKIVKNQHYQERLKPWLISLIENATITKNLTNEQ